MSSLPVFPSASLYNLAHPVSAVTESKEVRQVPKPTTYCTLTSPFCVVNDSVRAYPSLRLFGNNEDAFSSTRSKF